MAEMKLTFGAFSAAECEALLRASDKVVTVMVVLRAKDKLELP